MTEKFEITISNLNGQNYVFELDKNAKLQDIYYKLWSKTGYDINSVVFDPDIPCDETQICEKFKEKRVELKFQPINEKKEVKSYEEIKKKLFKFVLGRDPLEEELKNNEVDEALEMIYEGSKECRKCGFVFIPEHIMSSKKYQYEVELDTYLEQKNFLVNEGYLDLEENSKLLKLFNGDIKLVIDFYEKIKRLEKEGFTDDEINREALYNYKGDLEKVIDFYEKMERLEKEGFTDEEMNKEALYKYNSDLENVIDFYDKMKKLSEMGFSNVKKNKEALYKYNGNIEKAINSLF